MLVQLEPMVCLPRQPLAAFWPPNGAKRCRLLRNADQDHARPTGVWAGSGCACISLRIRRSCNRVPGHRERP